MNDKDLITLWHIVVGMVVRQAMRESFDDFDAVKAIYCDPQRRFVCAIVDQALDRANRKFREEYLPLAERDPEKVRELCLRLDRLIAAGIQP